MRFSLNALWVGNVIASDASCSAKGLGGKLTELPPVVRRKLPHVPEAQSFVTSPTRLTTATTGLCPVGGVVPFVTPSEFENLRNLTDWLVRVGFGSVEPDPQLDPHGRKMTVTKLLKGF